MTPDAPDEVIRAAYRALVAKYHPDRNPGDRDAELKLKRLNAAFRVLGDAETRAHYDELTQGPDGSDESKPEPRTNEPTRSRVPEEPAPREPRRNVPSDEERPRSDQRPTEPSQGRTPAAHVAGVLTRSGGRVVLWVFGFVLLAAGLAWLPVDGCHERHASTSSTSTAAGAREAMTTAATAPPQQHLPADVPPLLLSEAPPMYGLNFFEPHEMSSGGIVAQFNRCLRLYAGLGFSAEQLSTSCTCTVDAIRRNFPATGQQSSVVDAWPTDQQLQGCHLMHGGHGGPLPFAFASPRSTTEVRKAWTACAHPRGEEDDGSDYASGSGYCDCFVDLTFAATKNSQGRVSQTDATRCDAVGRYWAATRSYLTRRQFEGIGTAPPPTEQQQEAMSRARVGTSGRCAPAQCAASPSTVGADPPECMIGPGGCVSRVAVLHGAGTTEKITGVAEYDDASKNPPVTLQMVREVGGGERGDVVDVPYDLVQAGFKDGTYAFPESRAAGTHQGARPQFGAGCRKERTEGARTRRDHRVAEGSGSTPTSKPRYEKLLAGRSDRPRLPCLGWQGHVDSVG